MPKYEVTIEDLNSTELDELVEAIGRYCGGHTLEALTIRVA